MNDIPQEKKANVKPGQKKKSSQTSGYYFLGAVTLLTIVLLVVFPGKTEKALSYSLNLFLRLIPLIAAIITFTALINFFVDQKKLSSLLGKESGLKGWLIAIVSGIITHGPVYVWFSMLEEMKKHGMRDGLIAVFLYNRAIKIPLIPIMMYYFGTLYTIILLVVMVVTSPILGLLLELFVKEKAVSTKG